MQNASLGHAIGVLSGVGQPKDLEQAWESSATFQQSLLPHSANAIEQHQDDPCAFSIVNSISDILPIMFPDSIIPVAYDRAGSNRRASLATSDGQIRLIVFDKDGSLASVYPRWSNWAKELALRYIMTDNEQMINLNFFNFFQFNVATFLFELNQIVRFLIFNYQFIVFLIVITTFTVKTRKSHFRRLCRIIPKRARSWWKRCHWTSYRRGFHRRDQRPAPWASSFERCSPQRR